jgi:hypothetical protein
MDVHNIPNNVWREGGVGGRGVKVLFGVFTANRSDTTKIKVVTVQINGVRVNPNIVRIVMHIYQWTLA